MCIPWAGLSDDILTSGLGNEGASGYVPQDTVSDSKACSDLETMRLCDKGKTPYFFTDEIKSPVDDSYTECNCFKELDGVSNQVPVQESITVQDEGAEVELGDLFCEEASANKNLPPVVLKSQEKEKAAQLYGGYFSSKIDEIWKKVKWSNMRNSLSWLIGS